MCFFSSVFSYYLSVGFLQNQFKQAIQCYIYHTHRHTHTYIYVRNGHGNSSSDPGWGCLHFT